MAEMGTLEVKIRVRMKGIWWALFKLGLLNWVDRIKGDE